MINLFFQPHEAIEDYNLSGGRDIPAVKTPELLYKIIHLFKNPW